MRYAKIEVTLSCVQHPEYKGYRKPKSCKVCKVVYQFAQNSQKDLKFIQDRLAGLIQEVLNK